MEFNDLFFVFVFLPVYICCFYLLKKNKLVTLVFSVLFYLLSDLKYAALLLLVILITWAIGRKVKENKKLYVLYIVICAVLLFGFKYFNLIMNLIGNTSVINLMLPVGISYYLFEAFSYVSDCYYGKIECEESLLNIALYVSFFPTIISGPIIRYSSFKNHLKNNIGNMEDVGSGLRRFMIGLGKKIIIANQLVYICDKTFSSDIELSMGLAWAGLIAYALRLYYDFSGCADMAIGVGEMMGYKMPENFNDPYCSKSISEFFRRWHITLGAWFRDYIYIPLGGNRVSTIRWMINILVVWLFTGIWHGATLNYLIWGLFLGLMIIIEKKVISKIGLPGFVQWFYTTAVILFSWLIFNTSTLAEFSSYLNILFNGSADNIEYIRRLNLAYLTPVYFVALMLMIPQVKNTFIKLNKKAPVLYDLLVLIIFAGSVFLMVTTTQASSVYFGF